MKKPALKEVLAQRLRALMAATPSLDTQVKLAQRSGVAQSTIGRILRAEVGATLDVIESVAQAFGLDGADLLTVTAQHEKLPADLMAGLPSEDMDKIAAFIKFTVSQRAPAGKTELSLREIRTTAPELQAALSKAANRQTGTTTLNVHEAAPTHRGERSSKRRKPA